MSDPFNVRGLRYLAAVRVFGMYPSFCDLGGGEFLLVFYFDASRRGPSNIDAKRFRVPEMGQ